MTLKIRIRKHERGLRFRYGDYKQLLEPGTYWLLSRLWSAKRDTVDVVSTLATKLEHPMLEAILNPRNADAKLSAQVEVINGYSAHADRSELASWLDRVRERSPELTRVHLVHGEPEAQTPLLESLTAKGYSVDAPTLNSVRPL